jgi:CheY-like chemotaxis protein
MPDILELLIIEDASENIHAAQQYFSSRSDVKVTYVTNAEDAINKLDAETYHAAIVDINFPKKEGEKPACLGFDLAKQLNIIDGKYRLPAILFSGGLGGDHAGHGNTKYSIYQSCYCGMVEPLRHDMDLWRYTRDKDSLDAWSDVFDYLMQYGEQIDRVYASKKKSVES